MMPKTRNRRKFRKTPYAYSDSRLAHCRARYQIRSNVISGDSEIGCKILLRQSEFAPLEGAKPVTKYGSLQGLREVKMDDVEATENADGSQSSTSHSPTHQVSLSTGAFVNDDPTPSSVATRMEYNYHEFEDDVAVVPELLLIEEDAIVPSVSKPSAVTKGKETNRNEACGLSCRNDCHKNLTVGISYFSGIEMCEECVANIARACSQCQLAYRTNKMVSKAKVHHV